MAPHDIIEGKLVESIESKELGRLTADYAELGMDAQTLERFERLIGASLGALREPGWPSRTGVAFQNRATARGLCSRARTVLQLGEFWSYTLARAGASVGRADRA